MRRLIGGRRVPVNFSLLPVTVDNLAKLCKETVRSQGQMIDILVADAWRQYEQAKAEKSLPQIITTDGADCADDAKSADFRKIVN